jgi:3-oxoacyl-(acyl-carrier-protein) synthase
MSEPRTPGDPAVIVTGLGAAVVGEGSDLVVDPTPYLRARKSRKFMGLQDDLAVVAAGRALAAAGLGLADLGERAGLFLVVGYIPFDERDIGPVLAGSLDEAGGFSMARFADEGVARAHPLLTFRCLPNMPAYHVSANFDIQGPYLVGYPGSAQLYEALRDASDALTAGTIDVALLVGVASQRNFLVEHHFGRLDPPVLAADLRDAAGCLVLERPGQAAGRGAPARAWMTGCEQRYEPRVLPGPAEERFLFASGGPPPIAGELGPAALPARLAARLAAGAGLALRHEVTSRDGLRVTAEWGAP